MSPAQHAGSRKAADAAFSPGATLFYDDFESDTVNAAAPNWNAVTGTWNVCQPATHSKEYCNTGSGDSLSIAGSTSWTDYAVDSIVVNPNFTTGTSLLGRVVSATQFYQLELRRDWNTNQPGWYLWKANGTNWTLLNSGGFTPNPNSSYYNLHFVFSGSTMSAYYDYNNGTNWKLLGSATDSSYPAGEIGVRTVTKTDARFDQVRVTANAASSAPAPSPSPSAPATGGETAHSAGAFVNFVGVNMHNDYFGGGYTNNRAAVISSLEALGVHRIRDGISLGFPDICSEYSTLAANGIHVNVETTISVTATDIANFAACTGPNAITSVEGPNEYDLTHPAGDTNWPAELAAYQKSLYSIVKQQLPNAQVLGPTVGGAGQAQQVGDISASMDAGNVHAYFNGFFPGTPPYGGNGYGSLQYILAIPAAMDGSKPLQVTETGYGTAGGAGQVSETTQAKYIPRLLMLLNGMGVQAAYQFELIDEGTNPPFQNYGLLHSDLTPKPAYTALKSLLALMSDSNATATPGSLTYSVAASSGNVQHMLFQKSDGTFMLALWNEVIDADVNSGADIAESPVQATVTFGRSVSPTLQSYNSSWNLAAQSEPAGTSLSLPVGDAVELLTFK